LDDVNVVVADVSVDAASVMPPALLEYDVAASVKLVPKFEYDEAA
jgi:hypothetical protein